MLPIKSLEKCILSKNMKYETLTTETTMKRFQFSKHGKADF